MEPFRGCWMGSNCEQLWRNNIPCLRIADKHSLMEESEPMELMQKLTKWPPASQAKAWACSKVLLYGKFQWWCNTQASCITHAIHWACPVEFPDSGYKSSQQRRSASHSQPDLALYTSFLPLWNSIALLSLFGFWSLILFPQDVESVEQN